MGPGGPAPPWRPTSTNALSGCGKRAMSSVPKDHDALARLGRQTDDRKSSTPAAGVTPRRRAPELFSKTLLTHLFRNSAVWMQFIAEMLAMMVAYVAALAVPLFARLYCFSARELRRGLSWDVGRWFVCAYLWQGPACTRPEPQKHCSRPRAVY